MQPARKTALASGMRGLTLLELLVVLLMVALLASLSAPLVTGGVQHAREAALRENLHQLRRALDDYHADRGRYPPELDELVRQRYLRRIPVDPLAGEGEQGWELVRTAPEAGGQGRRDDPGDAGISDVRSRAAGRAGDGSFYKDW